MLHNSFSSVLDKTAAEVTSTAASVTAVWQKNSNVITVLVVSFGKLAIDQRLTGVNVPTGAAIIGKFLLIYICNFHVLSHLLLIYICKLHWNLNTMFVYQVNSF
jgi:hypothetical protein